MGRVKLQVHYWMGDKLKVYTVTKDYKGKDGAERNYFKLAAEWRKLKVEMKPHFKRKWWWVPFSHSSVNLPVEAMNISPYFMGHVIYFYVAGCMAKDTWDLISPYIL